MLGPVTYIAINKRVPARAIITAALSLAFWAAWRCSSVGRLAPLLFLLAFLPYSFSSSLLRPVATDTLLNQQDTDTGSASALIHFGNTAMGSLGMVVATLPWPDFVTGLGTLAAGCALLALLGWGWLLLSSIPLRGIKEGLSAGD